MLIAASLAGVLAYMLAECPPPRGRQFQVSSSLEHIPRICVWRGGGAPRRRQWNRFPGWNATRFVATDPSGKTLLWIRPLDSFAARPLPGTDGASLPFWSPDNQSIAFFVTGKLKKMDSAGGAPQTICDVP